MPNDRLSLGISGDRQVRSVMHDLPTRVERKGLRSAVTAAATPIVRAARAKAPRRSGLLKQAMNKKVKTYKHAVTAIIGAKRSVTGTVLNRKAVPANYIHLVEKGTKPHSMKAGGLHPGAKASPFLATAYREQKGVAEAIALGRMRKVVTDEAVKLGHGS